MPRPHRVFVSYSRVDFAFAEAMAAVFREHDLDPWLDLQRLRPGVDWFGAVKDAVH